MLTAFYLTFKDKESQLIYQNKRQSFYAKVLPLMALTQTGLSAALILYTIRNRANSDAISDTVSYVSLGAAVLFWLFGVFVRCSAVTSWFICPAMTALAFYYFAFLEYTQDSVSSIFAIVVAVQVSVFIVVIFNEVWLISTAVYAPLFAYYLFKMGSDFTGDSELSSELILRVIFCVILYAIVAYSSERSKKKCFIGEHTSKLTT